MSLFIGIFIVQLIIVGNERNNDSDYTEYVKVKFDLELVTAANILLFAYAY